MAWYWWVLIIVVSIFVISFWRFTVKHKKFLADISTWQVGDSLDMNNYYFKKLEKNGRTRASLIRWNSEEAMIDVGDESSWLVGHNEILRNDSDYWREKYSSMDKFMSSINKLTEYKPKKKTNAKGEVVEQESKMDVEVRDGQVFIDGQSLIGMPEIYLTIYQKHALAEGRNKLLAKINEELKKHR